MPLSLRAMRYVQAVLHRGSLTAAAEAMHVAPSAIAAALDQAELAFGMTLATRARSKGISPTSAGRDVQRRIDDLLDRYDRLLSDVADLQTGFTGNLTIGYNAPIAPAFLPAIAAPILSDHPGLSLNLVECDNVSAQKGLLDGQFDVIIFVAELPNPQIETQPLIFAPTYCICSDYHPFAAQKSVSLSDIARQPVILLDRPAARLHYMELLEQSGQPFRIVATANSTEMVRSLVASGLGVALLNMRPRHVLPYAGKPVHTLPITGSHSGVALSLGYSPGPQRQIVQKFLLSCTAYFVGAASEGLTVAEAE